MARGFHARGDLVAVTADQVDLNTLWDDYIAMLAMHNAERDRLVQFLTWRTTQHTETVFGTGSRARFEQASQYGVPVAHRPDTSGSLFGYRFKWWDLAGRFTWMYLADATSQQTDAFTSMAFEADNALIYAEVMRTLFGTSRSVNKEGATVYPFYAGVSGDLPPAYKTTTFADSHQHFTTTGSASALTAPQYEAHINLVLEHGYTPQNGYTVLSMVNIAEGNMIRQFRSIANGGAGLYDFIPASNQPTFLLPTDLRTADGATRVAGTYQGMEVIGSYGSVLIVQDANVPAGYIVTFATGGPDNIQNPIAIREHPTASLRGLLLAKGRDADYPLIDSYYVRGFGTGIRQRGAGAVLQRTASGTYTIPAQYSTAP